MTRCEVPGCRHVADGPHDRKFSVCTHCQANMTVKELNVLSFISVEAGKRFGYDVDRWRREVKMLLKVIGEENAFRRVEDLVSKVCAR